MKLHVITYDLFLFKGLKLIGSQWAFCGKMTSYRRRCDVITSHRRLYDVILRHMPTGVKPEFVHAHGALIFETGIQI